MHLSMIRNWPISKPSNFDRIYSKQTWKSRRIFRQFSEHLRSNLSLVTVRQMSFQLQCTDISNASRWEKRSEKVGVSVAGNSKRLHPLADTLFKEGSDSTTEENESQSMLLLQN